MAKKNNVSTSSNGKGKVTKGNGKAKAEPEPIRTKVHFAKGLSDLLSSGKIKAGVTKFFLRYKGKEFTSMVRKDGTIVIKGAPKNEQGKTVDGEYGSLSMAGTAIRGSETNGWREWRLKGKDGSLVPVGSLR